MPDIVFMFEVHQPYRLRKNIPLQLLRKALEGTITPAKLVEVFFDNELNKYVLERATRRCYVPATKILLENVEYFKNTGKPFKFSLSISGVFIEQARKWAPEVIELFQELASTGMVEFIEQTYYHSLVSLYPDKEEFIEQLGMHNQVIRDEIGYNPTSIENTEFIYNNEIACFLENLGYKVVLTEGVDQVLGWRSPNYVYRPWGCSIRVLTRNYRLSDDVGYRFSDKNWDQYPLTADKYAAWLAATPGDVVFIAMDYETFGEHHWPETGIHEFLKWLPGEILKYDNLSTETPSIAAYKYPVRDVYDVPGWATISWADERDLSAWLGNDFQKLAFQLHMSIEPYVKALDDPEITRLWRMLGISDHYYYMATKPGSVGDVHAYFSPYKNLALSFKVLLDAMDILVGYIVKTISENPRKYAIRIKLPWDKAFHFHLGIGRPLGIVARSIEELVKLVDKVPVESIAFHIRRGDLTNWIRNMFYWEELAREIEELGKKPLSVEELVKELKRILLSHTSRITK